jgi:translation initiation factor IF-1
MAKQEGIEMEGVVTDVLPDRMYRVKLENGHEVLAYAAGKMSKFKIRVLTGDRVTLVLARAELLLGQAGSILEGDWSVGSGVVEDHFEERLRQPSAFRVFRRSTAVRALYDTMFQYIDGDPDKPSYAAGTALGGAWHVAAARGDQIQRMSTAALGRSWSDEELAAWLVTADIPYEQPDDIAVAFMDLRQAVPGHVLVVPRRHASLIAPQRVRARVDFGAPECVRLPVAVSRDRVVVDDVPRALRRSRPGHDRLMGRILFEEDPQVDRFRRRLERADRLLCEGQGASPPRGDATEEKEDDGRCRGSSCHAAKNGEGPLHHGVFLFQRVRETPAPPWRCA